jgi:hypothetical protein
MVSNMRNGKKGITDIGYLFSVGPETGTKSHSYGEIEAGGCLA